MNDRTPPIEQHGPEAERLRDLFRRTSPAERPVDVASLILQAKSNDASDTLDTRGRALRMFIRISAAAAITAITATLISLIPTRPISAAIEMAEVQRQVAATKNLAFTMSHLVDGVSKDSLRLVVREDGVVRNGSEDGYAISDFRDRKVIIVRTKEKRAIVMEGTAFRIPETFDFYRLIREIANDTVQELEDRRIEGRLCKGLKVQLKLPDSKIRTADVWIDPETKLPVLIEMTERKDGHEEVERFDRFEYDRPIPESFFSMTPPDGFKVETFGIGSLVPEAADRAVSAPTLTPLVGIGPAKFRMTEKEVIEALGKPDRQNMFGSMKILSYYSRGYELWILPPGSPKPGLINIACLGQHGMAIKIREFQGKTDKGIGLGASRAEIVKIYGKPSYENVSRMKDVLGKKATDPEKLTGQTEMAYNDLGLRFTLFEDKVYRIDLSAPRPEPAKK